MQQRFPASLSVLSAIRQIVTQACHAVGLPDSATYRLTLAVDEIATNIITHGYEEQDLTGDIVVAIENTAQSLTVLLQDTGVAYDPRTRNIPTAKDLEKPLEDREIGGLGIFLAIQGVDRFDYQRSGDVNCNLLEMRLV